MLSSGAGAVSFVVQAHPSRGAAVGQLRAELARQGCPEPRVEWDTGRGAVETWRDCLSAPPAAGGWLVYLQDDAWPAPDFAPRLGNLLARGPFAVLMLYSARKEAAPVPRGYATANPTAMCSAVGLVVASGIVPAFAAFYPDWLAAQPNHTFANDLALGAFCRRERLPVAIAAPPLVQHRPLKSLLGHRRGRESKHYRERYGEVPEC
ncbi:hypothetical protein VT84_09460 [Gemmata sp. SH-PL17]|uniref:hypothetical protein n=1 Tax=Gemmata sp. SH-PL17 TaxID=1630693 RepID=UPI00078C1856|nr:hypothetical protein [Gemmata sp. SH-PL17]AMV24611.1 hypothetical protein VT84_09460 [Gemmata sp. SH-PL17]